MQILVCEDQERGLASSNMEKEMVAFFNQQSCPVDWEPYNKLNGRYILPAPDDTETGEFNKAFGSGKQEHGHAITIAPDGLNTVKVNINDIGMEASEKGILGVARNGWAKNASPIEDISARNYGNDNSETIPHVELLPCIKTKQRGNIKDLPGDMMAFMTAENCPNGWSEKSSSHGRYLVGLTKQPHAKSGTTFGSALPLRSGEIRQHDHTVNYVFNWPHRGFVGFTGSSNNGFAADGNYDITGTTNKSTLNMPYVQIRHCITPTKQKDGRRGIKQ